VPKGLIDHTGDVFGDLTVLHRVENSKGRKARWLAQCSCGKHVEVLGQ